MKNTIQLKTYQAPPLRDREILRYAGGGKEDAEVQALLQSCLSELLPQLSYRLCYLRLPLEIEGAECRLGPLTLHSKDLAACLADCKEALIFAATIGLGADRLIQKYSRISPARAMMLQAIAAERIESLCDTFCKEQPAPLSPRFSAGYGDLPLKTQQAIFALLDCPRKLGLYLNESLLMVPSKSVTAIAGIKTKE